MSGMRPIQMTLFLRSLRARGKTLSKIADELFIGRSHLSQVVNGRRSGGHTWRKLKKVLTVDELKLLETCSTWKPQPTREPLCQCGKPRELHRPYCSACTSARNREYRAKHPIQGEARLKANARSYLHTYIRRGKIIKGPCADCGSENAEAHHSDYSKPLDVVWLCRKCHMARHGITHVCKPRSKWHLDISMEHETKEVANGR